MKLLTPFRGGLAGGSNGVIAMMMLVGLSLAQSPAAALAADGAVAVGTNITFLVSADGSPSPTFQWQKNGSSIPGATGQTFSIAEVTLADAATYQVVATNEVGSAVSPDEVLLVETAPTSVAPVIITQPAPVQTLPAGGTATFTVSASGIPAPTFQWHKNGLVMADSTGTTLTLVGITTNDNATYAAVVANSAGSATSNSAVLTVSATVTPPLPPPAVRVAPAITTQPATQTAIAGGSVSFIVAASGTPAPTFQWRKNGVAIAEATNTSLTLSSLTAIDGGSYTAVASNMEGSVTSYAAILNVTEPVVVVLPPPASPPPVSPPPASPPPSFPPPASATNAAPAITTQPIASQTLIAGSRGSLTVAVSGNPAPKFQWRKNGVTIAGATNATLSISPVTTVDAASYTVIATNVVGAVVSEGAVIVVNMRPTFTVQPIPQAVTAGATARLSVTVSAIPGASLQWARNGVALPGATGAVLVLTGVSARDAGSYSVVASNALGSDTSTSAALVIAVPPVITTQPASQTVAADSTVTLSAAASGSPEPTFQWKKNGVSIAGATGAALSLKAVNISDAGGYAVDATNAAGWVSSSRASLTVLNSAITAQGNGVVGDAVVTPDVSAVVDGVSTGSSRLVNLSVRATTGTGSSSLIVGFVVGGASTKPLLIRGVGPTLRDFGVSGALMDPRLSLYSGATIAASNDDWMTNDNAVQIAGTSARVGAFSLPDMGSDSALMATLATGAYTVQLSGKEAVSGVALVEVYDAASSNAAKLVNLSVRAHVGTGSEVPNVGFVVAGTGPKRVLIRAVGPTLGAFGVTDALADPQLELYQGSTRIDHNDNWGGSAALSATFSQVGAFGFADVSSRDAVLLVTLAPGPYTVVVSGTNGTTGVGLVELYEVP